MKLQFKVSAVVCVVLLLTGSAMANKLAGVDLSGLNLKPGERIVAIDGVPVSQLSARQRQQIRQSASRTSTPAKKVTVAKPMIDQPKASQPESPQAKPAPKKVVTRKVPQPMATNIVGNLVRSNKSFSHSNGLTALDKANTERRKQGYGPLIPDPALQALALRKATIAAQRGYKNHIGGSLGGAKCEGVGWTNGRFLTCCLDERGTYGGAAMVQGRDGWYCCLLVR